MDTKKKDDPGDKSWNNEQKKTEVNEGFSGENLPENYNPSRDLSETETTADGSEKEVDRARNASANPGDGKGSDLSSTHQDTQQLKSRQDHNYDHPQRYPKDSPENKNHRSENP